MLLLSLGPDLLAALMRCAAPPGPVQPDLSWLLFGPDMAAPVATAVEIREQIQAAE